MLAKIPILEPNFGPSIGNLEFSSEEIICRDDGCQSKRRQSKRKVEEGWT